MGLSDKRVYKRQPIATPVVLVSGETRTDGIAKDISLGGMFIETAGPLPYGTRFVVEIKLRALQELSKIDAIVRWAGPNGMGVQFGSLRAKETWAINQLVK